jgi:hypothetical protein
MWAVGKVRRLSLFFRGTFFWVILLWIGQQGFLPLEKPQDPLFRRKNLSTQLE